MADARSGTLAEDNIGGAKLDVENTSKCARLNCILPQKSRMIGRLWPSDDYNDDNDDDDDDFG